MFPLQCPYLLSTTSSDNNSYSITTTSVYVCVCVCVCVCVHPDLPYLYLIQSREQRAFILVNKQRESRWAAACCCWHELRASAQRRRDRRREDGGREDGFPNKAWRGLFPLCDTNTHTQTQVNPMLLPGVRQLVSRCLQITWDKVDRITQWFREMIYKLIGHSSSYCFWSSFSHMGFGTFGYLI